MNSWKQRIQNYNEENNIVIVPFQTGGTIQHSNVARTVPPLTDSYFNEITLNGKTYSLKNKKTVKIIGEIINYYNKNKDTV
jgi:hypothetical protein